MSRRPHRNGAIAREAILELVGAHWLEHGYAPTLREIGAALGYHSTNVRHHVKILVSEGRLTEEPGRHRTLQLARSRSAA